MKSADKIALARLPTPLQHLKNASRETGKSVFIWRDDLNGFCESGNKIRKLEYLVADALAQGCDTLVTCGASQSNHTRATAVVARQHGLDISILTLVRDESVLQKPASGNFLLNQILAAETTFIRVPEFNEHGSRYDYFLEREKKRLIELGKKPYLIPLGGSNALGCQGYRHAVPEMLESWRGLNVNTKAPSSIFCAMGSGGTLLGLSLGLQDQGLAQIGLYGINVTGDQASGQDYLDRLRFELEQQGMPDQRARTHLVEGYLGEGYSLASDSDLRFYQKVAREDGIILDPCYTGKAFRGMMEELKKNPNNFGDQILFLHSGGQFANFAYAEQYNRALNSHG